MSNLHEIFNMGRALPKEGVITLGNLSYWRLVLYKFSVVSDVSYHVKIAMNYNTTWQLFCFHNFSGLVWYCSPEMIHPEKNVNILLHMCVIKLHIVLGWRKPLPSG